MNATMAISPATSLLFTPTCADCKCLLFSCCPRNRECWFHDYHLCISCLMERLDNQEDLSQ